MDDMWYTLEIKRRFFEQGRTKKLSFRRKQLLILKKAILENEKEIVRALRADLNKSEFEAYETEIGIVLEELSYMLRNLDRLARPKRAGTPLMHFPAVSTIYEEPYGNVLIMAPWNYPFQLAMAPLIGAMAAGNCCTVKPSDYAPCTSKVIERILSENFEEFYINVVTGGRKANQELLQQKFDYIFFTGSVEVGKLVMESASKNLTPVTLELGGKSPCIVDETANIPLAARRIVWGKFLNAGQTCVAPDYILADGKIKRRLIAEMARAIQEFYGKHPERQGGDYPKIINKKHFDRLVNLMDSSGRVVYGGNICEESNKIAPAILDDVSFQDPIMMEEIFGPLLPVLEYRTLEQAVIRIGDRPKPLALYIFSRSRKNIRYVLSNTSSGGGCVNDTVVHLATSHMPFGGVGQSGMGGYHGDDSFHTFSHRRSILQKSNLMDLPFRYPSDKNYLWLLKRILK